jgi:hypothetical protein
MLGLVHCRKFEQDVSKGSSRRPVREFGPSHFEGLSIGRFNFVPPVDFMCSVVACDIFWRILGHIIAESVHIFG